MDTNFELKAAIIRRFGSQVAFCKEVGFIRELRLSRLINGRAIATPEEKNLISQKLGCELSEIFPPQD